MKIPSPVLDALARLYEKSHAGRTGLAQLDFQPTFEELLKAAGCSEGDGRDLAERELLALNGELVVLEFAHKRTRSDIFKIRLPLANEAALFRRLGRPSPTEMRARWSEMFREAETWGVPEECANDWIAFCRRFSANSVHWQGMSGFQRHQIEEGRALLDALAKLLAMKQRDQFVRAVSCRVCGKSSKWLERKRGIVEGLLAAATGGRIRSLADLEILDTPHHVLVAGPLRLRFHGETQDIRHHGANGVSLAEAVIERAELDCPAARCVTVENKTSFHQRALQHPEDLHIHTSYPGAAALALLIKLPPTMEFHHFGDTDPTGFDILRDLRQSTRLPIRSLGMHCSPCPGSAPLKSEERALLEKLAADPAMIEERPELLAMLASKRKGVFEQEHR